VAWIKCLALVLERQHTSSLVPFRESGPVDVDPKIKSWDDGFAERGLAGILGQAASHVAVHVPDHFFHSRIEEVACVGDDLVGDRDPLLLL